MKEDNLPNVGDKDMNMANVSLGSMQAKVEYCKTF